MNHHGYPSSLAQLRSKLEVLLTLPDDAEPWRAFMRDEIRLAPWMLPAVQAAVRQEGWRDAPDPIVQIRSAVHRLAIEMRLRNANKVALDLTEAEEDE